jgi:hypothetical protein
MVLVTWHLRPDLFFVSTITTGGDTASHYYSAWWLRYQLLPAGHLTGWVPGNYAGFPLFQVYFPLPFLLMAGLSFVTGLPVAFKLVTVSGLIGLPLAAYAGFRVLRFAYPAPAFAAAFTVPFLFHEADSVWGANISSTLAGEFTYSFGTALLIVFAATLYRGAMSGRGWAGNGLLLAAIGLSHAYTLLAAGAFGAYLVLFHPEGRKALPYLAKVGALAFSLMAFWALPLVAFSEYTTGYSIVWPIDGFTHVFPVILWPTLALLIVGTLSAWQARFRRRHADSRKPIDHRGLYLFSLAATSGLLYLAAWKLDVVDIRFLPFAQLMLTLLAALPAASVLRGLADRLPRAASLVLPVMAVLAAGAALTWSSVLVTSARSWAGWNYGGFERTPGWASYRGVNDAVARTWADPRVAYEHNAVHNDAGSVRAFESLPLFSGASTLEGLYMQSTVSSPFVFYIQSEISTIPSCPLLPYHCGRLDPSRAAEHLRLYNVSDVIVRSDEVRTAFDQSAAFTRDRDVPPYTTYRVNDLDDAYVVPLAYEPIVLDSPSWKADFFAWFKRPGAGDVPLLRAGSGPDAARSWTRVTEPPSRIPRIPLSGAVEVTSELEPETIRIHTSRPGHPLLVKVSYHPRWRVEGAEAVWLASPSFMLIVPTGNDARLVYGWTAVDVVGSGLTAAAMVFLLVAGLGRRRRRPVSGTPQSHRPDVLDRLFARRRFWTPVVVLALAIAALGIRLQFTDPWLPHRAGLERFLAADYAGAEPLLLEAIDAAPSSTAAYYSFYYYALSAYRMERWEETMARFSRYVRDYPDGEHLGEAHIRMAEALEGLGRVDDALAAYVDVMNRFPDTQWAGFAAARVTAVAAAYAAYDGRAASLQGPATPDNGT